jgi:hypothetical protein
MKTNKEVKIRSLRNVTLIGDPNLEIYNEKDAKKLAKFLMQNFPGHIIEQLKDILSGYDDSPEADFNKYMKGLK